MGHSAESVTTPACGVIRMSPFSENRALSVPPPSNAIDASGAGAALTLHETTDVGSASPALLKARTAALSPRVIRMACAERAIRAVHPRPSIVTTPASLHVSLTFVSALAASTVSRKIKATQVAIVERSKCMFFVFIISRLPIPQAVRRSTPVRGNTDCAASSGLLP